MKFQSFFSLFVKSITTLFTKESQQCVVAQDGGLNYFRRLKKLKRLVIGRKNSKLKVRQQREIQLHLKWNVFSLFRSVGDQKSFFWLVDYPSRVLPTLSSALCSCFQFNPNRLDEHCNELNFISVNSFQLQSGQLKMAVLSVLLCFIKCPGSWSRYFCTNDQSSNITQLLATTFNTRNGSLDNSNFIMKSSEKNLCERAQQ